MARILHNRLRPGLGLSASSNMPPVSWRVEVTLSQTNPRVIGCGVAPGFWLRKMDPNEWTGAAICLAVSLVMMMGISTPVV